MIFRVLKLKNHRCVRRHFTRYAVCCCRTPRRTRTRCLARIGVLETRARMVHLKFGACVIRVRVTRRRIRELKQISLLLTLLDLC